MTHDEEFLPTVLTATVTGDLGNADCKKANEVFSEVISKIAKGCVEKGAVMIGHIKANFVTDNGLLTVSCTTNDGAVRCRSVFDKPVGKYSATFNVIVFGTEYDEMSKIFEKEIKAIPGTKSHKIIRSDDSCTDPDCHDPNCKDPHHRHFVEIK